MSNQKNAGRKVGSKNIIRTDLRKELTSIFLEKFSKEVRNFPVMDYEKRMRLLIGILPYILPKANLTKEESEIQNLIYEKIQPEFRKLNSYLNVIPSDKKPAILLSFIKQLNLTSTQQDDLLFSLKNKGRNIKIN
ncbi:hypothetical protein [Flavobacterium gyeonganense]|uniref:Uncharacterized protein n=1 Tax=Flavobacterium gyeonganense TaxID=1310418 RepID=A0ABV5H8G1_9FLAO|nr:hypothetical protein [Flavobacterium gyeonganense]